MKKNLLFPALGIGRAMVLCNNAELVNPAKPDRRSSGEDDLQNYAGNAQIKTVGQNTTIAVMLTNRMPVIRKSLRPA